MTRALSDFAKLVEIFDRCGDLVRRPGSEFFSDLTAMYA
jgi:hypothetical protein